MNKNPIFIEYYSHEKCECYKVRNPWTKYSEEVIVLCSVSEGIGRATVLAAQILVQKLADALAQPMPFEVGEKVHYLPQIGKPENGIVKLIHATKPVAFVVYHCGGEWNRYQDFTGQATDFDDLRKGWK